MRADADGSRHSPAPLPVLIRLARPDDIAAIKTLADAHRRELGFVVRASLEESCRRGELFVAISATVEQHASVEAPDVHGAQEPSGGSNEEGKEEQPQMCKREGVIGFLQAYFRRDDQATLHATAVASACRERGVGRALVQALIDAAHFQEKQWVRLRCPMELPANAFYRALGFHNERVEHGKRRPLRVWCYDVSAATLSHRLNAPGVEAHCSPGTSGATRG